MKSINEILKNRITRNYTILSLLVIMLFAILYFNFLRDSSDPEKGALRAVRCPVCHEQAVKQVVDINDKSEAACSCAKCGAQLCYSYKCSDCQYEFALVPQKIYKLTGLKTMEKFHVVLETQKCPNCGSIRTEPMSIK